MFEETLETMGTLTNVEVQELEKTPGLLMVKLTLERLDRKNNRYDRNFVKFVNKDKLSTVEELKLGALVWIRAVPTVTVRVNQWGKSVRQESWMIEKHALVSANKPQTMQATPQHQTNGAGKQRPVYATQTPKPREEDSPDFENFPA